MIQIIPYLPEAPTEGELVKKRLNKDPTIPEARYSVTYRFTPKNYSTAGPMLFNENIFTCELNH